MVTNSSLRTVHLYLILSWYPKATGFQNKLAKNNTNKLPVLRINYNFKRI